MGELDLPKIGLLTDLHYNGGGAAMNRLYEAVSLIGQSGAEALLLMGDLVNGRSPASTRRLLREVAALCGVFEGPVHFMPGNHDLDDLSKPEFYSTLGCAGHSSQFCFSFGGYTFVCLDGNYSPDGSAYDCGNFTWQESFIPDGQLEWLQDRLADSQQPVIVASHQRIGCDGIHSVRNHAAVCEVIAASGKVRAVLQGHRHEDDLQQLGEISCYTLAAHVDGAGPAVLMLDDDCVRLIRDYRGGENA